MSMTMHHEQDNTFRLDLSGQLTKAEFDQCQHALGGEIQRHGAVRLLVVLTAFEGCERVPGWRDLSFYVTHGDAIERVAIVGDEKWRSEMLMFASADLRRAPVEFFSPPSALPDARRWLST
jgi:hypothetical protein